jgi:hypothetical protein
LQNPISSLPALARDDVAVVVKTATGVAFALLASVRLLRESVELGQTLVAIPAGDEALAAALAAVDVTALVVDRAQRVASASLKNTGH